MKVISIMSFFWKNIIQNGDEPTSRTHLLGWRRLPQEKRIVSSLVITGIIIYSNFPHPHPPKLPKNTA
jgi:hypothetical protein